MCAGRCREPRRKGTWVADLSGCIVPWAARASCWPQPQQLLPVSAAGSGRRCCTGAFLPAGLFGGSMLFESTRSISLISSQNKNLSVLYMLRLFGGRGWITRAALLKTAHWAVFTLSSATAPQLFESTLASPFSRQIKQKLQYPVRILESLVGAGGFEPPKLKAADLQSVPIGHSGTRPYLFLQSCGLPVYVTTESAICQPIIWAGRKKRRNKGRDHKSPPARVRFTASGREGFSA